MSINRGNVMNNAEYISHISAISGNLKKIYYDLDTCMGSREQKLKVKVRESCSMLDYIMEAMIDQEQNVNEVELQRRVQEIFKMPEDDKANIA